MKTNLNLAHGVAGRTVSRIYRFGDKLVKYSAGRWADAVAAVLEKENRNFILGCQQIYKLHMYLTNRVKVQVYLPDSSLFARFGFGHLATSSFQTSSWPGLWWEARQAPSCSCRICQPSLSSYQVFQFSYSGSHSTFCRRRSRSLLAIQ